MKQLRSSCLGVHTKQAEPRKKICFGRKECWEITRLKFLSIPCSFCVVLILLCGVEMNTAVCRQLNLRPLDGSSQLEYTENFLKNSGGLADRKVKPKQVVHHSNAANHSRCLVRLFQVYMSHHPPDCKMTAFYLTPGKRKHLVHPHTDWVHYVKRHHQLNMQSSRNKWIQN